MPVARKQRPLSTAAALGLAAGLAVFVIHHNGPTQLRRRLVTRGWHREEALDADPFASSSLEEDGVKSQPVEKAHAVDSTRATDVTIKREVSSSAPFTASVHVVVTSNGNRYMNWQTRVFYRSFLKVQNEEGCALAAFTRVLHRTTDDELVHEIPTQRFDPLHPDCDVWCSYPVADRANAIQQWLATPASKRHEYVLVGETDYVFMRPLKVHSLPESTSMGFPFGYIVPTHDSVRQVVRRHVSAAVRIEDVPQTGNAPQLLRHADLAKVVPLWVEKTNDIERDVEAREKLGWIREMCVRSRLHASQARGTNGRNAAQCATPPSPCHQEVVVALG